MSIRSQDASGPVAAAAAALGAGNLRSIQYSGWGSDYIFGQAYDGGSPWPRFNLPGITIAIDYTTNTLRDDRRRAQAENPPLGGGFQPLSGELRQIWALSGGYAWDIALGINGQTVAPAAVERDMRSAVEGRTTQIWLTPHGFIKAAQAGNATVRVETVRGVRKSVITVTTPMMVRLEGVLNDQNLVERIETWLANPVLGDIKLEAIFSDYKDFGGVKFPTRILQRSAGYPVLDLTITDVMPNAPVALDVPASIRQAAAPPAALVPEKDLRRSVDRAGRREERRRRVSRSRRGGRCARKRGAIAGRDRRRARRRFPASRSGTSSTPITHFDHAGGLRTYAAEGATIVTQAGNIPYYQQVWSNPRTIAPDRLAKSGRTPVVRRHRRQPDVSRRARARWSSITTPATCTTPAC